MAHMNITFRHEPYLTHRKNNKSAREICSNASKTQTGFFLIAVVFLTSNVKESPPDIVAIAHDVQTEPL